MSAKKEIRAKDILKDIRVGMSNDRLMQTYSLSLKGLRSVLVKLVDAGILPPDEVEARLPSALDQTAISNRRRLPRCYPIAPFPICDLDDLRSEGSVLDISENGLKTSGIRSRLGERKNLLIQAEDFEEVYPFSFEAECRWTKIDADGSRIVGFEITTMPELGAKELAKILQAITFCE